MAYKEFLLDDNTPVKIYKSRSSRSLKISLEHNGLVRVTIPAWAPYAAGLKFALSKKAWIEKHRPTPIILTSGLAIGKNHHLELVASDVKSPKSRIVGNQIVISYPVAWSPDRIEVQSLAETASIKALRQQATTLLELRLKELAGQHGFGYKSLSIKQLKGRWGSCDQDKNIVLNLFLIQLPWECIDYVILHELIHTKVLKHGSDFWAEFNKVLPDAKSRQKKLRGYRPKLFIA